MEATLSIEDVSAQYGIPVQTLRWYRKVGRGPVSFKLGRRVRYLKSDCDAWVRAQYEAHTRDAPSAGQGTEGSDDNPSSHEGVAVMTSMAQHARAPQPRATCNVKWCTGCTWREDGEGWSRLHRAVVDGLVEVFAGESVHASEGTEHAPASVLVLGVPEELETPENTRDLAAALTKAARIQSGHRAVTR